MDMIYAWVMAFILVGFVLAEDKSVKRGSNVAHHNIIHTTWCKPDDGDNLNPKTLTAFRAILRTQNNVRFIVWTSPECMSKTEKQLNELKSFCTKALIEVRSTSELHEASKLETGSVKQCTSALESVDREGMKVMSPLIRFVALYFYGGIFIANDVLVLKALAYFQGKSFAYRSNTEVNYYNTDVMGLKKGSPLLPKIIDRRGGCVPPSFAPEDINKALDCPNGICDELIMFPTHLFDPVMVQPGSFEKRDWQFEPPTRSGDPYSWFFTKDKTSNLDSFFPGSYTFHWHEGKENVDINGGSYFAEFQHLNAKCQLHA